LPGVLAWFIWAEGLAARLVELNKLVWRHNNDSLGTINTTHIHYNLLLDTIINMGPLLINVSVNDGG